MEFEMTFEMLMDSSVRYIIIYCKGDIPNVVVFDVSNGALHAL